MSPTTRSTGLPTGAIDATTMIWTSSATCDCGCPSNKLAVPRQAGMTEEGEKDEGGDAYVGSCDTSVTRIIESEDRCYRRSRFFRIARRRTSRENAAWMTPAFYDPAHELLVISSRVSSSGAAE